MLIDSVNIEEYNAELIDRIISTTHINSYTDWMDEATEGILLRQAYDWRNIRLTFLIKEKQKEDTAYKNISALTQALKNCNIRFDDINLDFRCILTGSTQPERLQNGVFKIVYDLKNDWGRGDKVTKEWTIESAAGKQIKVNYVRNWAPTMESYTVCFDNNEVQERLGTDDIYVDLSLVEELAEKNTSWSEFFLELGVPVNKYKQTNELNGFLDIDIVYSAEEAKHILDTRDTFTIYYNRFHKDGYADFPGPKTYPSLVWQTGEDNRFYFDCGVGQGWNVQDITVDVIGRYYKASAASNGGMFGAYTDPYGLIQKGSDAYFNAGGSYTQTVFNENGSSGNGIVIGTLEDLASLPLREYAIKSSNEGASPIVGYVNFIFNGVTLTRNSCASQVLTNNITVGIAQNVHDAKTELAQNCDIARVRIYYKGQLVRDLIPIDGNLKNCFINNYDTGMYDVISMKYVGWKNYNSGMNGPSPSNDYMDIPGMPDTPLPPPESNTYSVTIVNGTGSGNYEKGALVTINANEPSNNTLEFDKWIVTSNNVTLLQEATNMTNTFTMVAAAVTVTATYKEKVDPDNPDVPDNPDPVVPPVEGDTYTVTVVNGVGSGSYKEGALVTIQSIVPDSNHVFDKWVYSVPITLTASNETDSNSFTMIPQEVIITATFKEIADPNPSSVTPCWLIYSDLNKLQLETDENSVGSQAESWNEYPVAGLKFVIAFSVPGVTDVSFYPSGSSGATLTKISQGLSVTNRFYVELKPNAVVSFSGCDITGTYKGRTYTQNFKVHSLL